MYTEMLVHKLTPPEVWMIEMHNCPFALSAVMIKRVQRSLIVICERSGSRSRLYRVLFDLDLDEFTVVIFFQCLYPIDSGTTKRQLQPISKSKKLSWQPTLVSSAPSAVPCSQP